MASSPEGLLRLSRRPSSRWTQLSEAAFQQSRTEAQLTTSRSNTGAIQMNSPPRSLSIYLRCVCIAWPRLRSQHAQQGYELSTLGFWPGLNAAIVTMACTRWHSEWNILARHQLGLQVGRYSKDLPSQCFLYKDEWLWCHTPALLSQDLSPLHKQIQTRHPFRSTCVFLCHAYAASFLDWR